MKSIYSYKMYKQRQNAYTLTEMLRYINTTEEAVLKKGPSTSHDYTIRPKCPFDG